jgi:glyoxylase-like metal-dependent hydrolase (beta-lactamase superfamily II)
MRFGETAGPSPGTLLAPSLGSHVVRRVIAGLILAAAAAGSAAEGTLSAGLASQARAREVLDAAVQAIGGEAALRSLRTVRRDYLEDWVDVGQGQRPWNGSPDTEALPPHAGFDDSEGLSFLDYAGDRYYESIRYADSPNDYAVILDIGTPERAFQTIQYVREQPFFQEHPAEERETQRNQRFRRHPEGLLRMALERIDTLLWLGQVEEYGERLDVIAFADPAGNQQLLYFDEGNHRLLRAETRRGHPVYGDATSDTVYSDYRRVGGLYLPHVMISRVGGVPTSREHMRSIAIDSPARDEWFQPPAAFVAVEPNPTNPAVYALGAGLYLIRGAYNLVFAEFRDQVLLVEAPAGEPYLQTCLALIEATVPGKPVHLVATHFHFDHIAGVRAAVARGIPVVTTADARNVIERSLASRRALHPDALARQPREARIDVITGRAVLDDGSQRAELYDFGPAPHVTQILVAYFPRQKVLHVADLFDVLTPDLVIAGLDAVGMAERIQQLELHVERIVPMHGVPVTIEHLRRGLEIRREYQEGLR